MLGEKAKRKERRKEMGLIEKEDLNLTTAKEVTDVQALMEIISGGKELNETRQKVKLE